MNNGNWVPVAEATIGDYGKLVSQHPRSALQGNQYVYRIRLVGRSLPRLVDESDVLYIGKGKGGRVHDLWKGRHSANLHLMRAAWAVWREGLEPLRLVVETRRAAPDDVHYELLEMGLLNEYLTRHGELPPFNRRFEGWLAPRALEMVADRVVGGEPSVCHGRGYSWPKDGFPPASTVVDLYEGPSIKNKGAWLGSLVWVWPNSWAGGEPVRSIVGSGGEQIDLRGCVLVCQPGASGIPIPTGLHGSSTWGRHARVVAWCDGAELSGENLSEDGAGGTLEQLLVRALGKGPPVQRLADLVSGLRGSL